MLNLLRDRAADARVTNLECVQAGFLIAHLLRPGGILCLHDLIYDFQPNHADEVLNRWLDSAVDDPARGYTHADLAEHVRTEPSTFRWLLEPMLAAAGFEIVTADFDRSVYGAYTCRRLASEAHALERLPSDCAGHRR